MSLLPTYHKDMKNAEESVPLWSADEQEHSDTPPAYPPRLGGGGSASGSVIHNINYVLLNGNWKEDEEAMGILGQSKEETIDIVKRGFPVLSRYPSERIEFLFPIETQDSITKFKSTRWVKILDEVWPRVLENPPQTLKIQIGEYTSSGETA
ncbi:uncharacterized protein IL334_005281 [Kwoniella shivajii]|uniref:Uncharacterized protein n=1 Tax=Kwoniella shivajii TaxID=564305 RepID=A0ABZ1D2Q0_9TREE|nr:hypothetical protein IL334_005281 [Kwoniella shivajii]